MKDDLTIIYYTANFLKSSFADKVRANLLRAAQQYPIISVSQKELSFGRNICVGDIGRNIYNIYRQILTGAKAARTEFVGLAEDDVLYSFEHFSQFRPPKNRFAFNIARWELYTWHKQPRYGLTQRRTNTTMIAPRELLVEALEERFKKYPDISTMPKECFGEPSRRDTEMGLTKRLSVKFISTIPVIVFCHSEALGFNTLGKKKRLSYFRAFDIPVWGKAEDVMREYYGS